MKDLAKLRRTDTNLLIAFNILMEEQSVSRAAERLFISQSAMSNTLKRLRTLLNDPLFVRISHGLKPTRRAIAIHEQLRPALQSIASCLETSSFDPASYEGQFKIATPAVLNSHWLRPFMNTVLSQAPGMRIATFEVQNDFEGQLRSDELDFAISIRKSRSVEFSATHLIDAGLICVCREEHPITRSTLTPEAYLEATHTMHYAGTVEEKTGEILDSFLKARYGRSQKTYYHGQDLLHILNLVAHSDLVLTTADTSAPLISSFGGLVVVDCSAVFDDFSAPIELVYLKANESDPAYQWLVAKIMDAFKVDPDSTAREISI